MQEQEEQRNKKLEAFKRNREEAQRKEKEAQAAAQAAIDSAVDTDADGTSDVQDVLDRMGTITGSFSYYAKNTKVAAVNFNAIDGTGDIEVTQPGDYSFTSLTSAGNITLGDNYKSHRIVGTNQDFFKKLYKARLIQGKFFKKPYEVVLGYNAAIEMGLKQGDSFYGSHGIDASIHEHQDAKYYVVGLLDYSGEVIDNLILTSLESVWQVHSTDHQKGSFDLKHEKKYDHHHHNETIVNKEESEALV